MITDKLPEPDCTAGCDEGWLYRYEGFRRIESQCGHCLGTGKEPPLTAAALEALGQAALPL